MTEVPGFPSRIYAVKGGKLALVQELAGPKGNTAFVIVAKRSVFVVPQFLNPGTVTFLDPAHPAGKAVVTFPAHTGALADASAVAVGENQAESLLLVVGPEGETPSLGTQKLLLVGEKSGALTDAVPGTWSQYTRPFWTPSATAATTPLPPLAVSNTSGFSLLEFKQTVTQLAPSIPDALFPHAQRQYAIQSSDQYLLAGPVALPAEVAKVQAAKERAVLLFDRSSQQWSFFTVEGNASIAKFSGDWISWSVAQSNRAQPSPGRSSERSYGTDELPNVAALYGAPEDSEYVYHPGVLILENPRSKRRFRIVTQHEDSEVLYADADSVLYRVDDTIYKAPLRGDGPSIGTASKIVKDEDVPEVHWVFYAP